MFKKSQFVFYSCLSFISAVGLASFFILPWAALYLAGLAAVILIILSWKKSRLMLIGCCLLFFAFGLGRFQLSLPEVDENHLAFYNNPAEFGYSDRREISFRGVIINEPDVRQDHIKYLVEGVEKQGRVLVRTGLFPRYDYGDSLEIGCALTEPEPIEDFAYDKYLALSDVYSICYQGRIKLLDSNQGNWLKALILKVKSEIVEVSGKILPEPQAAFLGGLLWGAKKGLPEKVLENFSRTGVTHIIAVSGYNITIIAVTLTNLFIGLGLSRRKAFFLIVLGIVFFVVITGSPASIVRAGIMGLVALISQTVGRATKMHNTLVIVCVLMLLFNPKVLIWDAGFQLSFLATIGLIYFSPILEKYTKWLPSTFALRESFTTTLSAIILTTPLILFQFGRFSFLAPIANLLILPVIPINMAVGFLAVISGLFYLPLGRLVGYVSWAVLTYVLKLTEILGSLPWASMPVPGLHWLVMVTGYLIIFFIIFKHEKTV